MFTERELPLPLCSIDPDFDCPEECPMFEESLKATLEGAKRTYLSIEEYKAQVRQMSPLDKAEIRGINRQTAIAAGKFELCVNHEDAKFGIGFDQ